MCVLRVVSLLIHITASLTLALLLSIQVSCSEDSGTADSVQPADAVQTNDSGPGKGEVGAPCADNDECNSKVCYSKTCAKVCAAAADCAADEVCTSDDGQRLFCLEPTYDEAIGTFCGETGTCAGLTCPGGKGDAEAYCTTGCMADIDCPPRYACLEGTDGKKTCVRRGFCARCLYDGMCAEGYKCVVQGSGKFCAKTCAQDSTECPPFSECKDAGGAGHVCLHKSGSCVGQGKICDPCLTKSDCGQAGGEPTCWQHPGSRESFCTTACTDGTCPTGYACAAQPKVCLPIPPSDLDPVTCVGSLSPHMEVGDTMEDLAMMGYVDSNNDGSLVGEKLKLIKLSDWSTTHKVIYFDLCAGWAGDACVPETASHAAYLAQWGPKGLMIVQALVAGGNWDEKPTVAFLDLWVTGAKPPGAAGIDPSGEKRPYFAALPWNMLLDAKTLTVLEKWKGYDTSGMVDQYLQKHLGP